MDTPTDRPGPTPLPGADPPGGPAPDSVARQLGEIRDALVALRDTVVRLQFPQKESYTTAEAAEILGRRPFTVREWCRHGRVNAVKADCGRGATDEWRISRAELDRIRNDGLLPEN